MTAFEGWARELANALPRGLTTWCVNCNGFVPTHARHPRRVIEIVVTVDGVEESREALRNEIATLSFCAHCGNVVAPGQVPPEGIDRLRYLAEIADALLGVYLAEKGKALSDC